MECRDAKRTLGGKRILRTLDRWTCESDVRIYNRVVSTTTRSNLTDWLGALVRINLDTIDD